VAVTAPAVDRVVHSQAPTVGRAQDAVQAAGGPDRLILAAYDEATQTIRGISLGARTVRTAPARCRPSLEALETRYVPSTLVVTETTDTGMAAELRGEIAAAASGDTITFADNLAGQTITLDPAKGQLELSKDLTIRGLGADQLTISGNDLTRVFWIDHGATDTITGLTIANGSSDIGGSGIYSYGTLTLDHSTLSGNHADRGVQGGGGIYNYYGTVTLDHSTLSGNHADYSAFGGGGIYNYYGTVTLDHSTLSGNHADGNIGGGNYNYLGTLTLDHSTLSGNHADNAVQGGGGIWNLGGTLTLNYSTVTNNSALVGADLYNSGGIYTLDHSTVEVIFG
jgi:hypothetical protein